MPSGIHAKHSDELTQLDQIIVSANLGKNLLCKTGNALATLYRAVSLHHFLRQYIVLGEIKYVYRELLTWLINSFVNMCDSLSQCFSPVILFLLHSPIYVNYHLSHKNTIKKPRNKIYIGDRQKVLKYKKIFINQK